MVLPISLLLLLGSGCAFHGASSQLKPAVPLLVHRKRQTLGQKGSLFSASVGHGTVEKAGPPLDDGNADADRQLNLDQDFTGASNGGGDGATLPQVERANERTSANYRTHLHVLVHGLSGKASDLAYLSAQLEARGFTVLCVRSNEGRTTDGVREGAARIAHEVSTFVREFNEAAAAVSGSGGGGGDQVKREGLGREGDLNPNNPHPARRRQLESISMVGHSLGGVYARLAVAYLFNAKTGLIAGLQPMSFMTLATPHLGVRRFTYLPTQWLPPQGRRALSRLFIGQTGLDLFLDDADEGAYKQPRGSNDGDGVGGDDTENSFGVDKFDKVGDGDGDGEVGSQSVTESLSAALGGKPLLLALATEERFLAPLRRFRKRTCYGCVAGDFLVPFATANLQLGKGKGKGKSRGKDNRGATEKSEGGVDIGWGKNLQQQKQQLQLEPISDDAAVIDIGRRRSSSRSSSGDGDDGDAGKKVANVEENEEEETFGDGDKDDDGETAFWWGFEDDLRAAGLKLIDEQEPATTTPKKTAGAADDTAGAADDADRSSKGKRRRWGRRRKGARRSSSQSLHERISSGLLRFPFFSSPSASASLSSSPTEQQQQQQQQQQRRKSFEKELEAAAQAGERKTGVDRDYVKKVEEEITVGIAAVGNDENDDDEDDNEDEYGEEDEDEENFGDAVAVWEHGTTAAAASPIKWGADIERNEGPVFDAPGKIRRLSKKEEEDEDEERDEEARDNDKEDSRSRSTLPSSSSSSSFSSISSSRPHRPPLSDDDDADGDTVEETAMAEALNSLGWTKVSVRLQPPIKLPSLPSALLPKDRGYENDGDGRSSSGSSRRTFSEEKGEQNLQEALWALWSSLSLTHSSPSTPPSSSSSSSPLSSPASSSLSSTTSTPATSSSSSSSPSSSPSSSSSWFLNLLSSSLGSSLVSTVWETLWERGLTPPLAHNMIVALGRKDASFSGLFYEVWQRGRPVMDHAANALAETVSAATATEPSEVSTSSSSPSSSLSHSSEGSFSSDGNSIDSHDAIVTAANDVEDIFCPLESFFPEIAGDTP